MLLTPPLPPPAELCAPGTPSLRLLPLLPLPRLLPLRAVSGIGVGVPMSRVYSHFMGGSIEWETDSWQRHTTVTLSLPKHGFVF